MYACRYCMYSMYVCIVCMHVCMHVCMYVCTAVNQQEALLRSTINQQSINKRPSCGHSRHDHTKAPHVTHGGVGARGCAWVARGCAWVARGCAATHARAAAGREHAGCMCPPVPVPMLARQLHVCACGRGRVLAHRRLALLFELRARRRP